MDAGWDWAQAEIDTTLYKETDMTTIKCLPMTQTHNHYTAHVSKKGTQYLQTLHLKYLPFPLVPLDNAYLYVFLISSIRCF